MVTLVPMTVEQWEHWLAALIPAYAADMTRVGSWPADDAIARATASLDGLLPRGMATPGHHVLSILDDAGQSVGVLWFAPADVLGTGSAYVYDLQVYAPHRGRGLGRAALAALEPVVRDLGYDAITLNVFGDNEVARSLYRSSGYVETNITMRKPLD